MQMSPGLAAPALGAFALLLGAYAGPGAPRAADAPQTFPPPASFAQCKACHSVTRGGPAMMGPNLFGIVGAPAGSKPGYAYSSAMKQAHIRWDRARLDAYLADPKGVVPGTRMAIPGIGDARKRKEIIDYLATLK